MKSLAFQLNEAKMFADITDGIAIVINSATGIYYGMNGFGTAIFENLLEGSSTSDIAAAVKEIPGVSEDFDSALDAFIDSLVEFELVVPRDEAYVRTVSIDPSVAVADEFKPVCTAYQDVQELLFADPIHEVDVDEGWKPE
ncbi:MAG: PqqD family protein [Bacteroidales bacterium]|nr:PqqD family protein [Bacteroidales bacterium]